MKSIGVTFEPFDTSSLPNQEARRDSREADVEDQQGQSEFTEASESSQKHAERSHMATLTREVSLLSFPFFSLMPIFILSDASTYDAFFLSNSTQYKSIKFR